MNMARFACLFCFSFFLSNRIRFGYIRPWYKSKVKPYLPGRDMHVKIFLEQGPMYFPDVSFLWLSG